jgi:RecA-family ATPase/DNA polymerase I-like protein with 3'-5' exonuclease and polymerase domains
MHTEALPASAPSPATEAQPYARALFAQRARPFIMPASERGEGLRLIFDLESDGLLDTVTRIHCIIIGDLDSDDVHEYGPDQISDALAHLERADVLIGHNIQGYDLPVLRKLHEWAPRPECRIVDTLVAARLILPHVDVIDGEVAARTKDAVFGQVRGKYSLEAWGLRLGMPKVGAELTDWSQWTPEIQARCVGDVAICKRLWLFLQPDGYPQAALNLEHSVAAICGRMTADGAPFDTAAAEQLRGQWESRRAELEARLREQFPEVKNFSSRDQIAAVLEARGWQPERRTEKTGQPVIDDELLESLPAIYPEFDGLAEHYILGRRLGQLSRGKQAWISNVHPDGRIHGGLIHIGTPHSRAKHLQPNMAQVPNHKKGSPFAAECRALFHHPGDWVIVTCDQSNLQDRGFAHYLAVHDGGAYAQTFADGIDQHWRTASALDLVPEGTARDKNSKVHTAIREGAKVFRYAFLFGAGSLRAGQIVAQVVRMVATIDPGNALCSRFWGGNKHPSEAALRQTGKRALDRFIAATPGLRELRERLSLVHRKRGWVEGLDGRRIPTDADYKALNRIVTASEAVICKRWLVDVHAELCARFCYGPDGDAYLTLWVHDELVVCCRPEIAGEVGEILVRHARKAGEPYGFCVPLDAAFGVGRDWAGTPLEAAASSPPAPTSPGPEVETQVDAVHPHVELAEEMPDDRERTQREVAKFSNNSDEAPDSAPPPEPPPDDPPPRGNGRDGGNGFDDNNASSTYTRTKKQWGAKLESTYTFQDAGGRNYQRELKWRNPDGTKVCQQQYCKNGQWVWKKPDGWIELPYRLPELLAAPPNVPVHVTEGPKDAETLRALGFIATTNAGGAGKFGEMHARWLIGKQMVYAHKDNNDAGLDHVNKAASALAGIVPDVRIVSYPDVPDGEDVTWWLDPDHGGHTKEELLERIAAAKPATPPLPWINMSNWDNEPVPETEWAVDDKVPLRQTTLCSGEGSAGKSTELEHLCGSFAIDQPWLGCGIDAGPAWYLEAEDEAKMIHQRLAPFATYHDVAIREIVAGGFRAISFAGQDALLAVTARNGRVESTNLYKRLLEEAGDVKPKMIAIASSANVYAGSEIDRSQVQQFIGLLTRIAIVANGAVVLATHPSLTGITSDTGLSGTTQWHNAVRARFYMKSVKPEDGEQPDSDLREIVFKKNNYGPISASIVVRYENGLYLPVPGTTLDQAAREAKAEEVFLELLKRFTTEGRDVSHKIGPSYAPARFAGEDEAKKAGLTKTDLVFAMRHLFQSKKIRADPYGRPSRPHHRIVII